MSTDSKTIEIKEAVQRAINFVQSLYRAQQIEDVLLEEVEYSSELNQWLITIGFSLPKKKNTTELITNPLNKYLSRKYKIINIDAVSGEALSMKIREIQFVRVVYHPEKLLLDTNLLLLLFLGTKDVKLILKAKTLKAFEIEDYYLLVNFINTQSCNVFITTPHILTEVSNLLGKEKDHVQRLGREALSEFVQQCEERNYPAVQVIQDNIFLRLGLTDTVIAIAAEKSVLTLTADAPLYHYIAASGAMCINFNHLRQGAWGAF